MTPVDNAEAAAAAAAAKEEEGKRKKFLSSLPRSLYNIRRHLVLALYHKGKVKVEQEAQQTPSCSLNQKSTERGGEVREERSRDCAAPLFFP